MNSFITDSAILAGNLGPVIHEVHRRGGDNLLTTAFFGGLCGFVCVIPALIVASKKGLNAGAYFWINVVAGAAGAIFAGTGVKHGFVIDAPTFENPGAGAGLLFAVPTGIVLFIVACVQQRGEAAASGPGLPADNGNWIRILCPAIALVLCLVVLPQKCTDTHTVALPDNRGMWDKITGTPPPTTTLETTSWGTVLVVTGIVTVVAFGIGVALADETKQSGNT